MRADIEPVRHPSAAPLSAVAAALAAGLPSLLAYNVAPSPTFLNQALAFALWGAFMLISLPQAPGLRMLPLQAALAVLVLAGLGSWGLAGLPAPLALSTIGTLLAAAVLAAGGAGAGVDVQAAGARVNVAAANAANAGRPGAPAAPAANVFAAFCWGWLIAGVLNCAVALVQVFVPDLPDGDWLAASSYPGRAVGNLRQPNHLSSLLLWHCIAVLALFEMRRLHRVAAALLLALGIFAVVLTASRTGLVSVLLLALWGLADRRLSRASRWLLLAAPLVYLLSWLAMAQWAALSQHAFGGSQRLAESDISSSRFAIWRDTLTLITQQPWTGVGLGEFNFAWTLTPLPRRPVAFFDHTHNFELQLAVELGLPLALAVCALLGWALWRGARQAWRAEGDAGTAQRCAMLMVLMIALHSQLEYPLWYSYFLLPAAWAFGYALQGDAPAQAPAPVAGALAAMPRAAWRRPSHLLAGAALAVVAGAGLSVADYARVALIFSGEPTLPPLEERIAAGRHSLFFAHHANYAAVTTDMPLADAAPAFDSATHYLLDTRLMLAWARWLAAHGQTDKARHIADRMREFHKVDVDDFFAPCALQASPSVSTTSAVAPLLVPGPSPAPAAPFQCEHPAQRWPWRAFLPQRP